MKDLFGNEIVPTARGPKISYAHPDRPGTGPQGEACSTCKHVRRVHRYFKCAVIVVNWTHGPGSDLCLSDKACSRWEKSVDAIQEVNE